MQRFFKPLYLTWFLAVGLVIVIAISFRSDVSDFYGIAESSEINVSCEYAVVIEQIQVIPGQVIAAGEVLVELESPELTVEINRISHQIEEFIADRDIRRNEIIADIAELKALERSVTSELEFRIREVRAQYALNRELVSGLTSLGTEVAGDSFVSEGDNPTLLEIERLETASKLIVEPYRVQILQLESELVSPDPLQIEIDRLNNELILLKVELGKLTIRAETAGLVGAVNFKNGETVPPFTTVITMHTKAPTLVKGYLHESTHNQIAIGQSVTLISLVNHDYQIPGEVVGVGSRIVAFPERLSKRPDVTIWGCEVVIRIMTENSFLLGEKILIRIGGK